MGPVSGVIMSPSILPMVANSATESLPVRLSGLCGHRESTCSARARSSGPPSSTGRKPRESSSPASPA